MSRRDALFGGCFAVAGFIGMFAGTYRYFLATETAGSWVARRVRLR